MFSKNKKKKEKGAAKASLDLEKYSFHVMPDQGPVALPSGKGRSKRKAAHGTISSSSAPGGAPDKTKMIGMAIIIGGAVAIVAGAFIVYRLSFGGSEEEGAAVPPAPTPASQPVAPVPQPEAAPVLEPEEPIVFEEEIPEEVPEPEEFPEEEEEMPLLQLSPSADSDEDGLTDLEEDLFGSTSELADSDEDGYQDGEEIRNGYSPVGPDKLVDTLFVKTASLPGGFEISYPFSWTFDPGGEGGLAIVRAATGEFFQVLMAENPEGLPVAQWFSQQNPDGEYSETPSLAYGQFEAILSPDSLTAYLVHPEEPELVLVVFYNPVDQAELAYRATFEMMLRSLEYVGQPAQ